MKEIEIENDLKVLFINTMIRLASDQSRSRTDAEHLKELEKIKEKLKEINSNKELIKLELSDSFYHTWIWRTFKELFSIQGRNVNKTLAKKLNRLHESTIGDYNEDFLCNYCFYSE